MQIQIASAKILKRIEEAFFWGNEFQFFSQPSVDFILYVLNLRVIYTIKI